MDALPLFYWAEWVDNKFAKKGSRKRKRRCFLIRHVSSLSGQANRGLDCRQRPPTVHQEKRTALMSMETIRGSSFGRESVPRV
jgi:hypothetical protein